MKTMPWVEHTEAEVEFLIDRLGLRGGERILDLACGYGRHALAFARRGFSVVGVDITPAYVEDANRTAAAEQLPVEFLLSDIREVSADSAFDVVLNLADGAVGYLENDAENLKIFDVIARALKPGGKHFMDIGNADHADACFPMQCWDAGTQGMTFSAFDWNPQTRIMLYGGYDVPYGAPLQRPEILQGDPTRLYTLAEVTEIFRQRGMAVQAAWSSYQGDPVHVRAHQMMVYSQKLA